MRKKIGVVLSGCGVHDGSEVHETVLTMLALDRAGADMVFMAPDKLQTVVVDHRSEKTVSEKRHVMAESARLTRGTIEDVTKVNADELDGVILPGGFGVTRNLSNFATAGAKCKVDTGVAKLLKEMHQAGKPIAALCIAPTLLSQIFGNEAPEITIGTHPETSKKLEAMGAKHFDTKPTDVLIDDQRKFITTPCYMASDRISDVAIGSEKAVTALLAMVVERSRPLEGSNEDERVLTTT